MQRDQKKLASGVAKIPKNRGFQGNISNFNGGFLWISAMFDYHFRIFGAERLKDAASTDSSHWPWLTAAPTLLLFTDFAGC